MTTGADILIRILGNATGLNKELKRSSDDVAKFANDVEKSTAKIGKMGSVVQGVFQGIGQAITGALINGVRTAVSVTVSELGKAGKAASDLNETISKTRAVFRDSSKDILDWSQGTARALGVSQQGALEATASLGNMFKQLGFGRQEAATFGKTLVETSADLVAFHNVAGGTEEVLQAIQSAFRGEYDPIQRFIPLINAATVEQQALADTGKESAKQLTAGEKAAAAYAIILNNLGDAAGAAGREINSAASQQRIFNARVEDMRATFGRVLLPIQQAFFRGLNQLIDQVEPYGEGIMDALASGLARGIVSILPVLQQLRAFFVYWLKPGSPPRLLRELTEWGKGAVKAYLEGWTDADFGALNELGSGIEGALRGFASAGKLKDTDLVSRVFGSQKAITDAINEWRQMGSVSVGALNALRRAAGPAGDAVAALTQSYFDLQTASKAATDAQRKLDDVTRTYDATLSPLQRKLDAITDKQSELRDQQRLEALGEIIRDPRAQASERQLARLEQDEILLRQQMEAIEEERDLAVDAEQQKIDAANAEVQARQEAYNQQKAVLDQQNEANALLAEEINLREKLANETLAKQEKAQREADQAAREAASELERIADAQLRYQLATTDTAGQLDLMRAQLAKVQTGSADYYDILTQIAGLEERLSKERAEGGGLLGALEEATSSSGAVTQASKGIQELSDALDAAFDALSGEGEQAQLNPFWQGLADAITNVGKASTEAKPLIQSFIDLVMGKDIEGTSGGADPFAGNWWLEGIIPGVNNIILRLGEIRDGDWSGVWDGFKWYVEESMQFHPNDPFWEYLRDNMIPAIEALAAGEWATAWKSFTQPVVDAFQSIMDKWNELFGFEEQIQKFMERWGFPTNPWSNPGPFNPSTPGQDVLPPSPFSSFPGSSLSGIIPAMAGAGGTTVNTYYIEQTIGTNGDFGGARQGAQDGIRAALIDRRLSGV